ncbi:MAG: autotransporter-associated beta strand repeat-containing protein [Thermoguttaceae bacterium]
MSLQKILLPAAVVAIAVLSAASPAWSSTDNSLIPADGTIDYALPGSWDQAMVPQAGQSAVIGSYVYPTSPVVAALTSDVSVYVPDQLMVGYGGTGDFDVQTGGTMAVGAILVGYGDLTSNTSTGILRISGGTIDNSGRIRIGSRVTGSTATGSGTVYQTAGSVSAVASTTMIGSAIDGSWNISGGSLAVAASYIGYSTGVTGTLDHSGGSVSSTGNTYLGFSAGATGNLNIHGNAVADFTGGMLQVGYQGNGTLTVSENGTLTTSVPITVGKTTGGTGAATFSGNSVTTISGNDIWVGGSGTGTMTVQDNAQLTSLYVYVAPNATTGSGAVFQTGGTVNATSNGEIGALGVYNISGGTFSTGHLNFSGGTLNQSGGQVNVTRELCDLGGGRLNLSGGELTVNAISVPITFSGGTLKNVATLTGAVELASGGPGAVIQQDAETSLTIASAVTGDGSLTKAGSGALVLTGANTYAGKTAVQAGVLQMTPAAYGNVLSHTADVMGGQMVFDYTGDVTPAKTIRASLHSGAMYTSTGAAAGYVVGYNDDGVSAVTAKVSLLGDTDLGGTVNNDDLARLLSALGGTDCVWQQGDFNYDSKVNNDDLAMLLSNLGKTFAGFGSAKAQALGGAVPEPSTLVLLTASLAGLLAYAWRKRK